MRLRCGTILAAAVVSWFNAFAAIDISTGRQLFVDDFLVEAATNVVRHWNRPVKMDAPSPARRTAAFGGIRRGESFGFGIRPTGLATSVMPSRATALRGISQILASFPEQIASSKRTRSTVGT